MSIDETLQAARRAVVRIQSERNGRRKIAGQDRAAGQDRTGKPMFGCNPNEIDEER